MLSRIAESLFWIGRYVERAEDTARLLDVHFHQLLEDPAVDETRAAPVLLAVHGRRRRRARRRAGRAGRSTELLGYDRTTRLDRRLALRAPGRTPAARARSCPPRCGSASTPPGTRCRERQRYARRVRPARVLLLRRGPRRDARRATPTSTMSRDDGWRFFLLGRSPGAGRHDRAAAASRVRHRTNSPALAHHAARARAPHEAYLRTYRGALDAGRVVRVPAAGPALPALGVPRAAPGRACASTGWTTGRPCGSAAKRRGAAAARRARTELEFLRARGAAGRPARAAACRCSAASATSARRSSRQYFPPRRWVGVDRTGGVD